MAHRDNVFFIEGSPARLIETLLRGRSTLRISELERLCAKFFDHPADRRANVERILVDQDVITLPDRPETAKPGYVTTRRIHSLLGRATNLLDRHLGDDIRTVTGSDEDTVIARIVRACIAEGLSTRPLILGASLSDCDGAKAALVEICGAIETAPPGATHLGIGGRGWHLQNGRLVIVPHCERLDDQRLALLILATNRYGSKLILGHDQSPRDWCRVPPSGGICGGSVRTKL
jgi:hypothetical protein